MRRRQKTCPTASAQTSEPRTFRGIAALGDVLTASRAADLVEAIEIAPIQPDVPAGACHLTAEGTTKPAPR